MFVWRVGEFDMFLVLGLHAPEVRRFQGILSAAWDQGRGPLYDSSAPPRGLRGLFQGEYPIAENSTAKN